jgi:hypothetical protein
MRPQLSASFPLFGSPGFHESKSMKEPSDQENWFESGSMVWRRWPIQGVGGDANGSVSRPICTPPVYHIIPLLRSRTAAELLLIICSTSAYQSKNVFSLLQGVYGSQLSTKRAAMAPCIVPVHQAVRFVGDELVAMLAKLVPAL